MGNPNSNIKAYGFGGKNRTKEFDDAARAKARGVPRKRKWSKEICILQLEDIMDILRNKVIADENLKDLQIITDKMMDIIRYLYPPVQQNVNVNLDLTTDAVLSRLQNWKKEQIVVIGEPEVIVEKEDGKT